MQEFKPAPRRKIFWLHQVQPVIPRSRLKDSEVLLTGPQLATATNRSQSNIYWRMRSRKLKSIGVKRYFKHGGRWFYLVDRSLIKGKEWILKT